MIVTESQRLLSLTEVARFYAVDRSTVRRWCRERRIACTKSPGDQWRVLPSALEHKEFIDG
jgi:excisionase family DNA binding protein